MYIDTLKEKVKPLGKRIVFPEGTDIRPIKAAQLLQADALFSEIVIVGDKDKVAALAKQEGVSIEGVTVIDPKTCDEKEKYASLLFERRKHKGMSEEKAREVIETTPLYTGAAMVASGRVDGMVAGCVNPTAEVIRSSLYLVGLKEGIKTLSSFFIMLHPDTSLFGGSGIFIYADCGVVPEPTPEQLADIAMATADSYRSLVGDDPKVALLSFSTKGSGGKPSIVKKVVDAKAVLDARETNFPYDGELQFDAAMLPNIASRKAPDSPIKGEANIFIFPDLNAGNICYKATERLANCAALGPILQGIKKPVNDLSRGCSAEDIADIALITALQSE